MKSPFTPIRPKPRLYRLAFAASLMGTTAELLWTACQLGQLPIKTYELGKRRLQHVDAIDLMKFLGPNAPDSLKNLFTNEELQ